MEYIRQMERKKLDIMSEFLVMAATLLRIKSEMLLPREIKEDGEIVDPRQELVERLLEYKMYKYISQELKDRQMALNPPETTADRVNLIILPFDDRLKNSMKL